MAKGCRKLSQCNCSKKHHKLLHTNTVNKDGETNVKSTITTTMVQNGFIERNNDEHKTSWNKIVLPVVPINVYLSDGSRFVHTYALIDSGSTGTFCITRLIEQLQLCEKQDTFSLTTLDSDKNMTETISVSLKVSNMEGSSIIQLPTVYARETLPVIRKLLRHLLILRAGSICETFTFHK